MSKISFSASLAPAHRFRVATAASAALAAFFPTLVLLVRGGSFGELVFALAGSSAAIMWAVHLLRPLGATAAALRTCLADDAPIGGAGGRPASDPSGAGGMVGDVAELAARIENLRQRTAHRHPITALPTREPFITELMEDMGHTDCPVLLAVVRFDDYDRLAAFDQATADDALKLLADRLKDSQPPTRPVAQVDRNCFALWFREAGSPELATRELQALTYVLGQELTAGELRLEPAIIVGASVFPGDGTAPAELLTRAVAALDIGRSREKAVAFFSVQGSAAAKERFALEQDLRHAVGRDEFLLHYQPIVDVEVGRPVGAEALLRWRRPGSGFVSPDAFIPILEQSPLMADVGLWVLNAACREAAGWREKGLGDLKVAVNLSATQCRDPRLGGMVLRTLERHGLASSSLELELTETAAMEDADHTRRLLAELRAHGVSVAIDDFGAGYSNLSHLKQLPFSKLKIDREFVTDVDSRRDSRAICAALITLSQGLGISVLAEGVETFEEAATLRGMGCRLFQGFYFARPMDGPTFAWTVQDPAWIEGLSISPMEAAALQKRARA